MNNDPDIAIVIATCNPTDLLNRMLDSLASCVMPPNIRRIIVAENGPTSMASDLTLGYQDRLPIEYHYFPNAKKCGALNRALDLLGSEFIIYFDDDVRIHPETLEAYAKAVAGRAGGAFFGGCCRVDYEEEPEEWLIPHLPAAATGWFPSSQVCELKESGALGFNWGAFADDIRSVGGYDERIGPGTPANSDEMNVQENMLKSGVKAYFLPDAIVWHYVPRIRCSEEWLLDYKRKDGVGKGIAISETDRNNRWKQFLGTHLKIKVFKIRLLISGFLMHPHSKFRYHYRIQRLEGKLEGMKFDKKGNKLVNVAGRINTIST